MGSGGRREGSGRKNALPGQKRVQMVITINQETKDKIKAVADAKGVNVGRFIDALIETLYK